MAKQTSIEHIDFEEEKAKLWQCAYSEIRRIIIHNGLANRRIELPNDGFIKSVILESTDVLVFEDCCGKKDFCEAFEDDVMFDVYSSLYDIQG